MELTTVPFIILVVYFATWAIKKWVFTTDETRKNLPPVAAAIGCAISLLIYFRAPELAMFNNIIDAATQGMASGLAAVGCNQIYKQYKKFKTLDDNSLYEEEVPVKTNNKVAKSIDEEAMTSAAEENTNEAFDDDRAGG